MKTWSYILPVESGRYQMQIKGHAAEFVDVSLVHGDSIVFNVVGNTCRNVLDSEDLATYNLSDYNTSLRWFKIENTLSGNEEWL